MFDAAQLIVMKFKYTKEYGCQIAETGFRISILYGSRVIILHFSKSKMAAKINKIAVRYPKWSPKH